MVMGEVGGVDAGLVLSEEVASSLCSMACFAISLRASSMTDAL